MNVERWRGGCEGEDCARIHVWRKARHPWKQGDITESHVGDGVITIASFSAYASISSYYNRETGPSNACHTEKESRTPPRVLL